MSWVKRARILPKGDVLVACAQAIFEEDLMHMCLSRSSYLYRFVFGRRPHGMHGFPEPWLDRMPLGVFCCLFAGMVVLRPFSILMLLIMDAMLRVVAFLADGSRVHGRLGVDCTISRVEPWPRIHGARVSPWVLVGIGAAAYQYAQGGFADAAVCLLFFGFVTLVARSMDKNTASPSEVLADAYEPAFERMLARAYAGTPWFLPRLRFVP